MSLANSLAGIAAIALAAASAHAGQPADAITDSPTPGLRLEQVAENVWVLHRDAPAPAAAPRRFLALRLSTTLASVPRLRATSHRLAKRRDFTSQGDPHA